MEAKGETHIQNPETYVRMLGILSVSSAVSDKGQALQVASRHLPVILIAPNRPVNRWPLAQHFAMCL